MYLTQLPHLLTLEPRSPRGSRLKDIKTQDINHDLRNFPYTFQSVCFYMSKLLLSLAWFVNQTEANWPKIITSAGIAPWGFVKGYFTEP